MSTHQKTLSIWKEIVQKCASSGVFKYLRAHAQALDVVIIKQDVVISTQFTTSFSLT